MRDFKNFHSTYVSTRSSVDGHKIILLYSHKLPVGYTMSMYTPYNDFFKLTVYITALVVILKINEGGISDRTQVGN